MRDESTGQKSTGSAAMRGKLVYQIYPRSFADGNGDGVGDIPGIIEHLDYLNDGEPGSGRSLGVNMIWLSPFYPSPMADFGYDVSDYCDVHPMFGNLDDFRRLVKEAKQRGIGLMVDFVPNHTSDQHPWFVESRLSKASAKRDWYIWRDPAPDGGVPNNWLSVFGGSAWELDEASGQYYMHSFLKEQPDLNWDNPEVRQAMCAAVKFWMDLGVEGIRVDAVNWLGKDREFRDNPPNPRYVAGVDDPFHAFDRIYSQGMPHLYDYLRELAEVVGEQPNGFMVTETYPYGADDIVKEYVELYQNYKAEVAAPFNFHAMRLPWSAVGFKTFIDAFEAAIEPHHVPVYVFGNHDASRVATRIGAEAARTAAVMLLTLPGVSFMYYGDELGMADVPIAPDQVQDPFEKRVPGMGLGRDPERTPMQWSAEPHAGFSAHEPWLPVAPDYMERNVVAESEDGGSYLALYRRLGQLRNTLPVLQRGLYRPLELESGYVYGFVRELADTDAGDARSGSNAADGPQRVAVILNFSDTEQMVHTDLAEGRLLVSARADRPDDEVIDLSEVVLGANDGLVVAF